MTFKSPRIVPNISLPATVTVSLWGKWSCVPNCVKLKVGEYQKKLISTRKVLYSSPEPEVLKVIKLLESVNVGALVCCVSRLSAVCFK